MVQSRRKVDRCRVELYLIKAAAQAPPLARRPALGSAAEAARPAHAGPRHIDTASRHADGTHGRSRCVPCLIPLVTARRHQMLTAHELRHVTSSNSPQRRL